MSAHAVSILCIAASLALLAGCSAGQSPATPTASSAPASSSNSLIAGAIGHALDKANAELATRNITVSNNDNEPKAEITPHGDFLIDGKSVPLTPAQRAEMLAYRKQLVSIAREGIAIGKQGADLGMSAAGAAIAAVFSGQSEQQVRARVEAKASSIRKAAAKICDRLPELMVRQQKLSAAVPQFRPYATLTQAKIDQCRTDALKNDH